MRKQIRSISLDGDIVSRVFKIATDEKRSFSRTVEILIEEALDKREEPQGEPAVEAAE